MCTWQAALLRLLCPSPSLPFLANIINKVLPIAPDVGRQMEYFLATGNLRSSSGLSLQQVGTHPHGHTPHWTHPTLDTPHTGHTPRWTHPHGHTPHWTHPTLDTPPHMDTPHTGHTPCQLDPIALVCERCAPRPPLPLPLSLSPSLPPLLPPPSLVISLQLSGFTVVADKLNYLRYLSHFRCVHRGAFFSQMRTTSVRKLLPEAWGFLCSVHTPNGAPCGLLNHFAAPCQVCGRRGGRVVVCGGRGGASGCVGGVRG